MRIAPRLAVALASLVLAACGKEPPPAPKPAPPPPPAINLSYTEMQPTAGYTLKTCILDDKPLGPGRYVIAWSGYEVQFCNKDCLKEFASDPETLYRKKVNPKAIFNH